jgi:hypothetical protein
LVFSVFLRLTQNVLTKVLTNLSPSRGKTCSGEYEEI